MGKIRISAIGDEAEKDLKEKRKVQREEKKKRESAEKVHISGMKGGQKVKSVGPSEEEMDKLVNLSREVETDQAEGIKTAGEEDKSKKKKKVRTRSKKYQEVLMKLDPKKTYSMAEALPLLRQVSYAAFDASVELHINASEKGLRGIVALPHGTGKKVRVAIATEDNAEKLVAEINSGKISFDALVAHPKAIPKLARVAKFLGPRGLMPNPKNGTISTEPEKIAKKLEAGEVSWKTETEAPVIHQTIGKMSFKDKALEENFDSFIKSVTISKIQKITLKSTMSPGIKIKFS